MALNAEEENALLKIERPSSAMKVEIPYGSIDKWWFL
jgi:hypothetical protein